MKYEYNLKAKIWLYQGEAAWHFVTIPKNLSSKITIVTKGNRRGWGSVRVSVNIGDSNFQTSIFPTKEKEYLLPIKKEIRKKEGLKAGQTVKIYFYLLGY